MHAKLAALFVLITAASGFAGRANALMPFEIGAAAAMPPFYVEVRHRWRRHRRLSRAKADDEPARSQAATDADRAVAQTPAPVPLKAAPKDNAKPVTPEPMGPPPPPANWSAAEIEAALADCGKLLSGREVLYDRLAPIKDGVCGTPAPIRLKSFGLPGEPAVSLSPAPVVSCKLAGALHRWFEVSVQPNAKTHLHASVVGIATLSAYNCRPRYDDPGQRISQHAFANALDVSEFITAKGEHVSVLDGWSAGDDRGAFLRAIHDGACQIFGTTLGPEANEAHKNHFHLDMKERRRPLCDFTPDQVRAQKAAKSAVPIPAGGEAKQLASDENGPNARNTSPDINRATVLAPQAKPGVEPTPAQRESRRARHYRRHRRRHTGF